jgi:hypothetical protein
MLFGCDIIFIPYVASLSHSLFFPHTPISPLCGWFAPATHSTERPYLFFGNSRVRHNLIIDSKWKAFLLFVCSEGKPGTAVNTSSMQRHGD